MHSVYSSLESPLSTSYSSQLYFFRYLLRFRRYKRKSVEVGVIRRGVAQFERKFQTKGGVTYQPLFVSYN